jgi:hypothetical protein
MFASILILVLPHSLDTQIAACFSNFESWRLVYRIFTSGLLVHVAAIPRFRLRFHLQEI